MTAVKFITTHPKGNAVQEHSVPYPNEHIAELRGLTKLQALYALGKPNLSLLVVVTAVLGFFLALSRQPEGHGMWLRATMLAVGTGLTAMGACAANMYREREVDGLMHRTRNRPLPSGQVQGWEALVYASLCFATGCGLLLVFTGPIPALLSLFTLVVYVFVYTPAKRRGPVAVWIGAIPGAVPPLMGWAAVTGRLDGAAFALFGLMFTWQFPHFLALAYMYRDDYARGGFRFLPRDKIEETTGKYIGLGTVAVMVSSIVPWLYGLTGWLYLIISLAAGGHFLWVAYGPVKKLSLSTARRTFLTSLGYLPVLLIAIIVDRMVASIH
ncbi:MAG: heme o synthase [Myxococcales bacterium]|nr:heme o synthase [Myxococcales bacterium]